MMSPTGLVRMPSAQMATIKNRRARPPTRRGRHWPEIDAKKDPESRAKGWQLRRQAVTEGDKSANFRDSSAIHSNSVDLGNKNNLMKLFADMYRAQMRKDLNIMQKT